jgi:hypothetical protein
MFDAFPELKPPTVFQVIGWWELRRLVYNVILLVVLIVTYLGILEVAGPHLPAGQDAIEPMAFFFFVPRYFLVVNAFYTLGWMVDLVLRGFHLKLLNYLRRRVFWATVLLSCLVTSVPFWFACAHWIGQPLVPQ